MLQIPIVVKTETMDHEAVEEKTHTLVVNAHGGLIKLTIEVKVGQPIVLVSPMSGTEEPARVVRIENPPGGFIAVAFEFDRPSPKFWPVTFPPSDWGKV
jgi:hypothetical protein